MPFDVPAICAGTLPVISWVIGAEVDPSVFASPRYCAVITWMPTGKFVVRNDTTPAFTRDGFPYVVPLSNNCTFPVGVALKNSAKISFASRQEAVSIPPLVVLRARAPGSFARGLCLPPRVQRCLRSKPADALYARSGSLAGRRRARVCGLTPGHAR